MTHQNKTLLAFDAVNVGDALPAFDLPPVSRLGLALYCGASGDHNPIHVDIDFAKSAGMPDVFAHGMLSMAWLGRQLTDWCPQEKLRSLSVRFVGITRLGDVIRCEARVIELIDVAHERHARLQLRTVNQMDESKVLGEAVVAL